MIIVDANELRRIRSVKNRMWVLLTGLASVSGHAIATADITFDEFSAGLTMSIEEAARKRDGATRAFFDYSTSRREQMAGEITWTPDKFINNAVASFRDSIRILKTHSESHAEAFRREIWRIRPASLSWDKPGMGARDTVLWLSAIEACKSTEGKLFFVSDDATAFGANQLHPELEVEVCAKLGDRASDFVFCQTIADLLSLLVEQSPPSTEKLLFEVIANDESVCSTMKRACSEHVSLVADAIVAHLKRKEASGYSTQYSHSFSMASLDDIKSYRIKGHEWLVTTMTWNLAVTIDEFSELRGQPEPSAVGLEGSQAIAVKAVIEVLHERDRRIVQSTHLLAVRAVAQSLHLSL